MYLTLCVLRKFLILTFEGHSIAITLFNGLYLAYIQIQVQYKHTSRPAVCVNVECPFLKHKRGTLLLHTLYDYNTCVQYCIGTEHDNWKTLLSVTVKNLYIPLSNCFTGITFFVIVYIFFIEAITSRSHGGFSSRHI